MKKHSLFKSMAIVLLLVVIATYFIPNRSDTVSYLALGDVFMNFIQSFYYFFDTMIFVLVIGGFYGMLSKTEGYKKLQTNIVKAFEGNNKKFIFLAIILFAVITSFTGISMQLLVFVPFVMSIILLMGYDKMVAISSTIGAMLVGMIGGVFLTFRDPSNYYGLSYSFC